MSGKCLRFYLDRVCKYGFRGVRIAHWRPLIADRFSQVAGRLGEANDVVIVLRVAIVFC